MHRFRSAFFKNQILMGTLFEQSPRTLEHVKIEDIYYFIEEFKRYLKKLDKNDIILSDFIQIHKVLEYKRRTDILVNDGDAKDEQLAGFGELLQELNQNIGFLNTHFQEIALSLNELTKK